MIDIDQTHYQVFDFGGARNERRKWVRAFESVTTVIFTVDIAAYDEVLFEDNAINCMLEALMLFDSICNSKWFANTQFVLFLHKMDKLERKLAISPMKKYFPDYNGDPTNLEEVKTYFRDRFLDCFSAYKQKVTVHFTSISDMASFTALIMASISQQPSPEKVTLLTG